MASPPPHVELITIPAALSSLAAEITKIRRKNQTLIDYYIHPKPVPSELQAHDPRLAILHARVLALSHLDYNKLEYVFDQSAALAAYYVNDIIDQLLNAVHGFREIFEQRYDRTLKDRQPFDSIYKLLEHRELQLRDIMTAPRRPGLPEDLIPSSTPHFCKGAVQLINSNPYANVNAATNRDHGRISFLAPSDLLDENRALLSRIGGAFLWWECASCSFRLRFHVVSSKTSSIHTTEQTKEHLGIPLEYHSVFLAKSHLDSASTSDSNAVARHKASGAKYGCIFCYAEGEDLSFDDDTVFRTGRDLALHLVEEHRRRLPPSIMLTKCRVAVEGKTGQGVGRWDLNFK